MLYPKKDVVTLLKEIYQRYKIMYKYYIVLIKNGSFYLTQNQDAIIMNQIFHYQLKEIKNGVKIGFPCISLNKVIQELEIRKINYLIYDQDIIEKQKFKQNHYCTYINHQYELILYQINHIHNILINNIQKSNIKKILEEIEEIVICKINS